MNQPWVYMCPPTPTPRPEPLSDLPPHSILLGCLSVLALSALFHALNLDWSSVSHMVIYMFQCYSLKSSHSRLLPQRLIKEKREKNQINKNRNENGEIAKQSQQLLLLLLSSFSRVRLCATP